MTDATVAVGDDVTQESIDLTAAVIDSPGELPRVTTTVGPVATTGHSLIKVRAAAVNPLDLAIAAGVVPAVRHEQPYVPGIECVGEIVSSDAFEPGTLVYAEAHPSPEHPGTFATRVLVPDGSVLALPGNPDPISAVAVGNSGIAAFVPLIDRAGLRDGDNVLILGATGGVGRLAVQIARAHGAGRIVAVGRDADALATTLDLGADETVQLVQGKDGPALTRRLAAAFGADGPNVVLDAIYGAAFEASLPVCAPGAHRQHRALRRRHRRSPRRNPPCPTVDHQRVRRVPDSAGRQTEGPRMALGSPGGREPARGRGGIRPRRHP